MRYLCIDPSSSCTGWAVIDTTVPKLQHAVIESGFIKPKAAFKWYQRVNIISGELVGLHGTHQVDGVAYEDITKQNNPKMGKQNRIIAGAMAYIVLSLADSFNCTVQPVQPSEWKQAIGVSGNANDTIYPQAIWQLYKHNFPKQVDESAALGIAAYVWFQHRGVAA